MHDAATINTPPTGIRFWGDEASREPDHNVIVDDPALLQFSDPGIAQGFGAGLVVVPTALTVAIAGGAMVGMAF